MKILKDFGHQGDISFRRVGALPNGVKDITKDLRDPERGGFTIALGERSNHAHTIVKEKGTKINIFEKEVDCAVHKAKERRRFIKIVGNPAKILHGTFTAPGKIKENEQDKHAMEIFPPGIYEQGFELGYDPFLRMAKKVID